jgi:hypothetical protein
LSGLKFFLKRVPLVVLGKLIDAVAATEDVLTYAERFRELNDVGPDVFNLLTVLRFNRDETIGNQTAEVERDLRAVLVVCRNRPAILAGPVWLPRFFQRGKKFARSRNADGIDAYRLSELIRRKTRWLRTDHGTAHQQKREGSKAPQTIHGASVPTCGQIASKNPFPWLLYVGVEKPFRAQKKKCGRAVNVSGDEDLVKLPRIRDDEEPDRQIENATRPFLAELTSEPGDCHRDCES